EFSSSRVDPFLPIFMIWNIQLNPLAWKDAVNQVYSPTNLTDFFQLDNDGVDYQYKMSTGSAVNFTSPVAVSYGNSTTMSSNSAGVLVYQIATYISNHPNDPENPLLQQISNLYQNRKFLSQAISGFNIEQVLASFVAQVGVENLLVTPQRDGITSRLTQAAGVTPNDNWYDFSFNSMEPIATGLMAQGNFGPLRSGFMGISSIEIVDTFGQRMDLYTQTKNADGTLNCITSHAMSPQPTDTANQGKIYLPPRILAPTRLWFQWLSSTFDPSVSGINADFVEMNSHPATSPICGWVMPNHLDNNLFFYRSDGSPIGTFGVEHTGTSAQVVYRTRAGNITIPPTPQQQQLTNDIGAPGTPTNNVNPTLANYMWYLNGQSAQYLLDLMASIQNSDLFINPANFAQNAALGVLVGRPLAITRAIVGMETAGNLLPLSQSDDTATSPFPQDVNNNRFNYTDRMNYSSANLGNVQFPLRLGNLTNLDDGLVGYLIEGTGSNPYTGATFYTPAATTTMNSGVVQPIATTIQLTLNAAPISITMLVDPRAGVHATTGVLPVNELSIPPDQYATIMSNLAVTFTTRPMLQMAQGLVVPLPKENGYAWSWITPGTPAATTTPLTANAANETPVYGYSPQTIQEGWLELNPEQNP
ncbi:MAG TPA: hypothetical protein VK826_00610, partial [Bacteroidia bacterium]|nr:hypothetical protein [Bacteroidia bacterium]